MRHLIVLVDALGWLTVERLGFLEDLLPFRRRLTTVFGYSSTAIPSLLTGTMPREHGHWFLFRRAGGRSPFREAKWIGRLPGNPGARWRVRSRLQELWRKRAGIDGYFSLYDIPMEVLSGLEPVETRDTWGTGSFPGTPTLIDHLAESGAAFHLSDWRVPDAEKIARAREALGGGRPRVVVLYLTEVDSVQHRVGTTHPEFDAKVRATGEAIRAIHELMGGERETTLSVFSDHGMTDVERSVDLFGPLRRAGLVRGRDYGGFVDSTVARFWNVRDVGRLRAVLDALPWGRRLPEAQLREWGVDFPGREYGEEFFLAEPGALIVPSDMGSTPLAAMHGYDPADPTSDACFLADRDVSLERDHIVAVLPALLRRLAEDR